MAAYYNENDPFAAQWLRNLIAAGHVADGEVDERDIRDVKPVDLVGFNQCHFFAGIGGWSLALRLAGWPDDRPVWTGSCPCQPFSAAGKGGGFDDERHLWPDFHHLIVHGKPRAVLVFGEQVASKDGLAWLDLVQADVEGAGYAFGATDICAAGVGAPHIRQRLWFVADPNGGDSIAEGLQRSRQHGQRTKDTSVGDVRGLERAGGVGRERWQTPTPGHNANREASERVQGKHGPDFASAFGIPENGTGPTNGHWRAADWLCCQDDKWRAVEPGTFPLAHGVPARVGRLRAYGNAIVPQVAAGFITAYLECQP